jgi:hypothetical protein
MLLTLGSAYKGKHDKHGFPVVNVGTPDDPKYLPADVCMVLPGQKAGTDLSPAQTQQMIEFTVRKPFVNAKCIVDKGLDIVGLSSQNRRLVSTSAGCAKSPANYGCRTSSEFTLENQH